MPLVVLGPMKPLMPKPAAIPQLFAIASAFVATAVVSFTLNKLFIKPERSYVDPEWRKATERYRIQQSNDPLINPAYGYVKAAPKE